MAKRKVKADIRGRAMAWLFLVCALLGCLLGLTLRPGFYASYWGTNYMWHVHISDEDADRFFEAIPRALNGDLDALRLNMHDLLAEQEDLAFNEREIAHMADVAHLYSLAKIVFVAAALVLTGMALWSWRSMRKDGSLAGIAKGALLGVLDAVALIGAVALWAVIDFRSAFWAFHHIAFTNDLWLLDSNDILIQMMPQSFFEWAAMMIGLYWLGCVAVWCACWGVVLKKTREKA